MNIMKCAKFNVILTEDYIIIKNRFERRRNSWQYQLAWIGIEFHNNFSPATLTFYEIFYFEARWGI